MSQGEKAESPGRKGKKGSAAVMTGEPDAGPPPPGVTVDERQVAQAVSGPANGCRPKIVVFACNWCSYAGADLAGVSRFQQPPDIRIIRTMCSGRVNPAFVIKAFELGADGVLWSGCHFGDCHYSFGNYRAVENYKRLDQVLRLLGVHPQRYRLEWVSAAEGMRWSQLIREFVEEVRALGPSPLGQGGS